MYSYLVTLVFTAIVVSSSVGQQTTCKVGDQECLLNLAKTTFRKIIAGDPTLGVESSDPLYMEVVEGTFTSLHYKLTNCVVTGPSKCDVQDIDINFKELYFRLNFTCPHFRFKSNYVINGMLIILPVDGNGKQIIDTKTYDIGLEGEVKIVENEDGNQYASIKNFKIHHLVPQERITFSLTNLFNGRKDLSDVFHKFVNENWKEVAQEFSKPLFQSIFTVIVKRINKYMKSLPLNRIIIP